MPVEELEKMCGLSHKAWLKVEDHEKDLKKRAKWKTKRARIGNYIDKREEKRKKMPRKAGRKAKSIRQSSEHAHAEDQQDRQDRQRKFKFNRQQEKKQKQEQQGRQHRQQDWQQNQWSQQQGWQQGPSLSSGKDPYAVLELTRPAKLSDVKTAFRKQIKLWHPDLARSSMDKASYLEQAQLITEAYDVLKQSLGKGSRSARE
jgi:hypothetical protein